MINQCSARVFPLPQDANDLISKLIKANKENDDSQRVLKSSLKKLSEFSRDLSFIENNTGTTKFNRIKGKLIFVSTVLENLTKFRNTGHFMEGKFWSPESGDSYVADAFYILSQKKELGGFRLVPEKIKKSENPPTRFKPNELLHQYQRIVNTYGVPRYKEVNPAVISSVTFPFLFGMMFGDIAHGSVLLLFGILVFLYGRKLADFYKIEHLEMRSVGVLLGMMGFFAVYAGLVYNDFLAMPLTFVKSCFKIQGDSYGNFFNRKSAPILIVDGDLDLIGPSTKAQLQFPF